MAYLQRLWIGEPLEEWSETETAGADSRQVTSDSETNLGWKPGPYSYDGAGNIKSIGTETSGTDTFAYDRVNRLKTAVVNGITESSRYDAFGNLLQTQLGTATPKVMGVDSHSNRLAHVEYDVAGNVRTSAPGTEYIYDSAGMMSGVVTSVGTRERMIYTADDERIAIYFDDDFSRWTIRNLDGKVLRTFAGNDWGWQWEQDYVYAGGTLVGGEREAYYGGRRHFHLDHLGSVRVSTNENRLRLGRHDYYPFGVEQTQTVQGQVNFGYTTPPEKMKFTGHERDLHGYWNTENADYLDYMHARHYDPNWGRFLSVDPEPESVLLTMPQSWNRYSYVLNNPINITDPTGLRPCRYKLTGTDAETAGVPDGTVVDGECVEAEADKTVIERAMNLESILEPAGNLATGFADTVTFDATRVLRERMGDNQVSNPCSDWYTGGQIAGVVWWGAAGGAVGGRIGGNMAARELGNLTLTNSQYAARGVAGLSDAQKFAAMGGVRGGIVQALKNAATPSWWGAILKTTATTTPTPAGWGGLVGVAVGGASTATSQANNDC